VELAPFAAALSQDPGEPVQDSNATNRREARPFVFEGLSCGGDGLIDVDRVTIGDLREGLSRRRIDGGKRLARSGGRSLPIDEHPSVDCRALHHPSLPFRTVGFGKKSSE